MNLVKQLLNSAKSNKLGHFYIIEPTKSSVDAQLECESFCAHFISEYFKLHNVLSPASVWDHADIITLGSLTHQEEITSNYSVEEALQFIKTFEYAPISSPQKFAIITHAQRMSVAVANKWLKLLEEPNLNTTIFLINSQRTKLLETIQSRGILLRLPISSKETNLSDFLEFCEKSKNMGLAEFLETNQKNQEDLKHWIECLIDWESLQNNGYSNKAQLANWLQKFREMETFHQPSATKWSLFYDYLQSFVFRRLIH